LPQILRQEFQNKISNSQPQILRQEIQSKISNSQARISKQNFPKPQVSSAGAD